MMQFPTRGLRSLPEIQKDIDVELSKHDRLWKRYVGSTFQDRSPAFSKLVESLTGLNALLCEKDQAAK